MEISGILKHNVVDSEVLSTDLLAFVVALLQNHTDRLAGMVARSGKVGSYTEHPSQSNFLGRIVRVRTPAV